MSLIQWTRRRYAAPMALFTLLSFVATLLPARTARASDSDALATIGLGTGGTTALGANAPPANAPDSLATIDLSTGAAQAQYQFQLPRARGDAQPNLALRYDSSAGIGFAGVGWSLSIPSITRKGSAGIPRFKDDSFFNPVGEANDPETDDYYIDGQLLVPLAKLSNGSVTVVGSASSVVSHEQFPTAVLTSNWMYFRREVDDGSRYFFNSSSWIVQTKSGHYLTFGFRVGTVPNQDTSNNVAVEQADLDTASALTANPDTQIYRWNLLADTDAYGNTVSYHWSLLYDLFPGLNPDSDAPTANTLFLTDVYDTLNASTTTADANETAWAHHVHLTWEPAQYLFGANSASGSGTALPLQIAYSTSPIWAAPPFAQLQRVDVTSATWSSTTRQLVNSYVLNYSGNVTQTRTFLTSIQPLAGTCCPSGPTCTPDTFLTEDPSTGLVPPTSAFADTGASVVQPVTVLSNAGGFFCSAAPATTYSYSGSTFITQAPFATPPTWAPSVLKTTTNYFISQGPALNSMPVLSLSDFTGDGRADLITSSDSGQIAEIGGASGVTIEPISPAGPTWSQAVVADWASTGAINVLTLPTFVSNPNNSPSPIVNLYQLTSPGPNSATFSSLNYTLALTSGQSTLLDGYLDPGQTGARGVDVDSDGLSDLYLMKEAVGSTSNPTIEYTTLFTSKGRDGHTYPFVEPTTPNCIPPSYDPTNFSTTIVSSTYVIDTTADELPTNPPASSTTDPIVRAMTDIDGDGIVDMVFAGKSACPACATSATNENPSQNSNYPRLLVLPGRGDGRFGIASNDGTCAANYGKGVIPQPIGTANPNLQFIASDPVGPDYFGSVPQGITTPANAPIRFGDLNGDGLADFAVLNSVGLSTCIRTGAAMDTAYWRCTTDTSKTDQTNGTFDPSKDIEIADLDGSGVNQVVYFDSTRTVAYLFSPNGATTSASGTPIPRDGLLTTISNGSGVTTTLTYSSVASLNIGNVPTPQWVVTGVSTTNGLSGAQAATRSTSYSYATPIYDPRDGLFVGFRSVTATQAGNQQDPGMVTKTTFETDTCLSTASCTSGAVDYSLVRSTRGLPMVIETSTNAPGGQRYTTTYYNYATQTPYTAVDGRVMLIRSLNQTSTYLWGEGEAGTQRTLSSLTSLPLTFMLPATYTLQQRTVDPLGNVTATVDFGRPGTDQPILQSSVWELPTNPALDWHFVLKQRLTGYSDPTGTTFTAATTTDAGKREFDYSYDPNGGLTKVSAVISTTPFLETRSNVGAAAAPVPAEVSFGGLTPLVSYQRNSFGEVFEQDDGGNPNQVLMDGSPRCTRIAYDSLFSQFPQTVTQYPYGCNVQPANVTTFVFERQLGVPTTKITPGGIMTTWQYDGWGRKKAIFTPSAQTQAMTLETYQAAYNDAGPVRRTSAQTLDSSGAPVLTTSFFDGFGDTLETVSQAGTPSNQQWIVSGMHVRSPAGRVLQAYKPFYTGSATAPAPVAGTIAVANASGPSQSWTYDGAGRVLTQTDFRGNSATNTFHTALLSVDIRDQEQANASSSHANAFTTSTRDGHGRTVSTIAHLASTTFGAGTVTTAFTYQSTGEPTVITKSLSSGGTYRRTMTYDSLGRMLLNNEPNTGGWTYAYNDFGELVATADARGCGENLIRDGLGRVIGEDYSPCEPTTQPVYSPPTSMTSPVGFEAFTEYTGDGLVAATADRAESSTYAYDPRDRLQTITRKVAAPAPFATTQYPTYLSQPYTKTVQYDLADRVSNETTGADSRGLLVSGATNSSVTTTYMSQGIVNTASSSYGNNSGILIAGQSVDASGALLSRVYGDAAGTTLTLDYDANETLVGNVLQRTPAPNGGWTTYSPSLTAPNNLVAADLTLQSVLASVAITNDRVGNPTAISEGDGITVLDANGTTLPPIVTAEWPPGAKPIQSQSAAYGDDYRLNSVQTQYAGPILFETTQNIPGLPPITVESNLVDDEFTPAYTPAEILASEYPPQAAVSTGNRVRSQTFSTDYRGNITQSTDDANDFPDRSLATVTNGQNTASPLGATQPELQFGPDQFDSASPLQGLPALIGTVAARYDQAGNMTVLSGPITEPSYSYTWDEVGRLSSVTRTDPASVHTVSESFLYGVGGARAITETEDSSDPQPNYTVAVFPSLVLQHAAFSAAKHDYDESTQHVYLTAGGIFLGHVFSGPGLPVAANAPSANVHVFMPMSDRLGSTSLVIDHDTSELTEAISYLPYGGIDSDYRPLRWNNFREDVRYSGHWDDSKVGLTYFGARFYSPELGRFISPDPLTIHGLSGDTNPYAFVGGSPLGKVDPFGLDPEATCDVACIEANLAAQEAGGAYDPNAPTTNVDQDPLAPSVSDAVGGLATDFEPGGQLSDFTDKLAQLPDGDFGDFAQGAGASAANTAMDLALGTTPIGILIVPYLHLSVPATAMGQLGAVVPMSIALSFPVVGGAGFASAGPEFASAAPTLSATVDDLAVFGTRVPAQSEGYFNVVTHANATSAYVLRGDGWAEISHRTLAQFIERAPAYSGGPVRLIACEAGACSTGLAQNLANKLGVEVLAPTEKAYVDAAGNFWADGFWLSFVPGAH